MGPHKEKPTDFEKLKALGEAEGALIQRYAPPGMIMHYTNIPYVIIHIDNLKQAMLDIPTAHAWAVTAILDWVERVEKDCRITIEV